MLDGAYSEVDPICCTPLFGKALDDVGGETAGEAYPEAPLLLVSSCD